MRTCSKCQTPLPPQYGKGRRRTLCETCSPPRRRPDVVRLPASPVDGPSVTGATEVALVEAGMLDSALGQAALVLARSIDGGQESGGALAALVKAHRETLAGVLDSAPVPDDDPVERACRELHIRRWDV